MTRQDALQEARRRWGSEGFAYKRDRYPEFRVGHAFGEGEMFVGVSWEAAFAEADGKSKGASA